MGRAKPIMIQGTMSNAGKSLLAAGLCRVLSQDGLRVAPFKSQNMALNSGVTADGLEMGRAQIMQAEACGIAPDMRMNPILLKPESDHRSQLIVAGKAQGAFAARDYFARKKALMPQILEAFDSLAEENDVIVIEGAGSPVEINLAENDIVNMGLARAVSSPVLLAGDIDPGGVFAQLYGTVALLAPEDRALLRGLVVNKFRGDVEILRPGLAPLEKMCGVPVVGVVPYLTLDLDDEDSLAPRLTAREARGVIDVASCAFRICRTSPTSTRFRACPAWACATFPRRPIWADPTWWCFPARSPRSTTRAGLRLAASEPVYARFRARARRCSAYAEATSFWETSFPTRTAGKALAPRAGLGSSLQVRCSRRKSASPSRSCASRAPKARSRCGTA